MSHTDRLKEDENQLEDLRVEVQRVELLQKQHQQQKHHINELKQLIKELEQQNTTLKRQNQQINDPEEETVYEQPQRTFYSNRNRQHFREVRSSPRIRKNIGNGKFTREMSETVDDGMLKFHWKNQSKVYEGFIEELQEQIDEKDRKIMVQKYQHTKAQTQILHLNQHNQELQQQNDTLLQTSVLLQNQNELLKSQLLSETELRCKQEQKLKQLQQLLYTQNQERNANYIECEKEFHAIDTLYEQFHKIVKL